MLEKILGFEFKFGILELLFAFYVILSAYSYGSLLTMSLFTLVVMDVIVIYRGFRLIYFRPLLWLFLYMTIHEVLLIFFLDSIPSSYINSIISKFVAVFSIFIIAPNLNYKKLVNSLMFVGVISMIGIVYHFILLQSSSEITPIKLPFFPEMDKDLSRVSALGRRPVSFYVEPAAFVSFMMIPLFISLNSKKFVLTGIIIFSLLLSTSTSGIAISFAMICFYIFTQKVKLLYKILIFIGGLGFAYFLFTSDMFKQGVDKLESIEVEKTSRLINGPAIVNSLDAAQLILGVNATNVEEFVNSDSHLRNEVLLTRSGGVFVSTFWMMIVKLGVIGLFLLFNLYYKVAKSTKGLLPLILVLSISLFSQGTYFNALFTYQWIFILAFIYYKLQQREI